MTVRLQTRAGSGGRLFGSVSTADIADAVKAAGGPSLDRRKIEVQNPIKTVGAHQVAVRLHPEVSATLNVEVSAPDRPGPRHPDAVIAGSPSAAAGRVPVIAAGGLRLARAPGRVGSRRTRPPPGQFRVKVGHHLPEPGQAARRGPAPPRPASAARAAASSSMAASSRSSAAGRGGPSPLPAARLPCYRTHTRTIGSAAAARLPFGRSGAAPRWRPDFDI